MANKFEDLEKLIEQIKTTSADNASRHKLVLEAMRMAFQLGLGVELLITPSHTTLQIEFINGDTEVLTDG